MQIEIDLSNKEKAAEQVKKIQSAFDELLDVCNDQKVQLLENIKTINETQGLIQTLQNSNIDMADTIKAIHRILQSKKDLFADDEEMKVLMDTLATFVVSSGAIKLGVLSNARDKENQKEKV